MTQRSKNTKVRVAVVGATGAVGSELIRILESRGFPYTEIVPIASSNSENSNIEIDGTPKKVEVLSEYDFSDIDLAFFSAGTDISLEYAPKAAQAGALVVDNTNAFRMDAGVPLIVPQVNGSELSERPSSGIVSNPNCSTIQMVRVLDPLHKAFRLRRAFCSTYQAASGGGKQGIEELLNNSKSYTDRSQSARISAFSEDLAFNVIPQIDVFEENGFTLEETKMRQETRKIMGDPNVLIIPMAVRVPVVNGHSESIFMEFVQSVDIELANSILSEAAEIVLHDENSYPLPRGVSGDDCVHVGRLHKDPEDDNGLYAWVVADNLRVGAALNSVQIAELLVEKGICQNGKY